jgi:hypothetical protein
MLVHVFIFFALQPTVLNYHAGDIELSIAPRHCVTKKKHTQLSVFLGVLNFLVYTTKTKTMANEDDIDCIELRRWERGFN